ncbi:MAG: hypothetical protein V7K47_09620 [Nostoc sp.]
MPSSELKVSSRDAINELARCGGSPVVATGVASLEELVLFSLTLSYPAPKAPHPPYLPISEPSRTTSPSSPSFPTPLATLTEKKACLLTGQRFCHKYFQFI